MIKRTLVILFSIIYSLSGYACCVEDSRTFTKMLLQRTKIIYFMEVIESYNNNGKCSAKVKIIESFFGKSQNDTIIIQTGEVNTPTTDLSVTGQHLKTGSKWLVYDGFTCNTFTKEVTNSKSLEQELNIVRTFDDIISNKKTANLKLTYINDKIIMEGRFKNGLADGNWKHYSYIGKLKVEENYKKGKIVGLYKEFNDNGKVIKECNYLDSNILCDTYKYIKTYHSNNNLKEEYVIKNGNMVDGEWKTYYENGQLKSFQEYKDNSPFGTWIKYSKSGDLLE